MERWSWPQFFVTAVVTPFLVAFAISPFEDLGIQLAVCVGLGLVAGGLAGRFGDQAWRTIVNALLWLAH